LKQIDRVYAVLHHEEPDVVPCHQGFTDVDAEEAFYGEQLHKIKDIGEQILFKLRYWDNCMAWLGEALISEELFSCGDHIINRTEFGSVQYVKRSPYFSKTIFNPVKHHEDLKWTKPINIETEQRMVRVEGMAESVKLFEKKGYFCYTYLNGPFESAWMFLRGIEKFLQDVVSNPSFAKKLVETAMKPQIEITKMLIQECGFHGVYFSDDLGDKNTLFISPRMYREIIQPWHKRIAEVGHKLGAFVLMHSHGNINLILKEIVDTGVDMIDPLDPYDGMNLAEVKEKYGDKISLLGGITRHVDRMSKEELKEHLIDRISIGAPGGGYMLGTAGGFSKETSKENLEYYRKLCTKMRRYPKRKPSSEARKAWTR